MSQDNSILNGHPTRDRFSGVAKLRVNCILFVGPRTSLNLSSEIVFYDN